MTHKCPWCGLRISEKELTGPRNEYHWRANLDQYGDVLYHNLCGPIERKAIKCLTQKQQTLEQI